MKKPSLIEAMAYSAILPGAGLTLLPTHRWFPIYLVLDVVIMALILVGGTSESLGTSKVAEALPEMVLEIGLALVLPVWSVSAVHTFVAVGHYRRSRWS